MPLVEIDQGRGNQGDHVERMRLPILSNKGRSARPPLRQVGVLYLDPRKWHVLQNR
jgi:hypothetical protein